MPPVPYEPRPTRLARLFPWVRIGRAPGVALDSRKMILAAAGLLALRFGWDGIGLVIPPPNNYVPFVPGSLLDPATRLPSGVSQPYVEPFEAFNVLTAPFVDLFSLGRTPFLFVRAFLMSVWAVIVWGLIGGAIARIAAVQMATGERMGIFSALRFARDRSIALIGAPLSPLIGIGFFAALCAPIGLIYRIPGPLGATIAGLLAFLPLLAGLVMALLLAGLAVGWPLMTATVAVEGEDAFDAVSRSYSYVTQRPGRYAAYAGLAWLAGAAGLVVVQFLAHLVIHMAQWGLDFGGPDHKIAHLLAGSEDWGTAPALLHRFWIGTVRVLTHAWVFSYFFSAAVIVYTLLRRDVDGAPYHACGALPRPPAPPEAQGSPPDVGPPKADIRSENTTSD